jgi:hypothetical protein
LRTLLVAVALLVPTATFAATPAEGEPLKVRRGFFTETDVGGFLTLGGDDDYSNLQPFLQLGFGYDIRIVESFGLGIGLHVGIGNSAANCYSGRPLNPDGTVNHEGQCPLTENFTVFFIDLTISPIIRLAERFYLVPKLIGGFTYLNPAPVEANGEPIDKAANIGGSLGIEYATNMDHFSIGLDVGARYVIGPGIFSLQVYPRVKYTF